MLGSTHKLCVGIESKDQYKYDGLEYTASFPCVTDEFEVTL